MFCNALASVAGGAHISAAYGLATTALGRRLALGNVLVVTLWDLGDSTGTWSDEASMFPIAWAGTWSTAFG